MTPVGLVTDIEGTFTSLGASAAIGGGGANVLARNQNGVQIELQGTQVGLDASLDMGGATVSLVR